jgi:hypothetical protein
MRFVTSMSNSADCKYITIEKRLFDSDVRAAKKLGIGYLDWVGGGADIRLLGRGGD